MTKKKAAATASTYVAVRNFEYPESLEVRKRIRSGEDVPLHFRGKTHYFLRGERVADAPEDLIEGWLLRGLVVPLDEGGDDGSGK